MQVAARPPDPGTATEGQGMRALRIIPKLNRTQEKKLSQWQLIFVKTNTEKDNMQRDFKE